MIYDCFIFFNEIDLLELRLNELDDIVDKFVIVESTETFSKKKKLLYYNENKDRFLKFKDKIIHVIVDDSPEKIKTKTESENRWAVEHFQRNCIERGLKNCNPDDIILVSDIDEIPRKSSINSAIEILNNNNKSIISFCQRFFYYYLNGLCVNGINGNKFSLSPWFGTTACRYEGFIGAEKMRMTKGRNHHIVPDAGWHFSYLGGIDLITYKIESFSHSEFDNDHIKDKERIKDRVDKGIDLFDRPGRPKQLYIKIDESFPDYLKDNIEKFKHLIKEV